MLWLTLESCCFLISFRFISGRWDTEVVARVAAKLTTFKTSATDFQQQDNELVIKMNDMVDSCHANCSGHGECLNGSCYCLIQFEGDECQRIHFSYHVAFSSIFFLLALTSLIQLVMCIHAEYLRMKKNPSIIKACRVTTQKFLYFLVFLAAVLRGAYFAAPVIPKSSNLSTNPIFNFNFLPSFLLRPLVRNGPSVWWVPITPWSWPVPP